MRIILQRVSSAHVDVCGVTVGQIGSGLLALVGITHTDTSVQTAWMSEKLLSIRLFPDTEGKMNLSLNDIGGGLLIVSQFTLYADTSKGTRPSFINAAKPEHAEPLFQELVQMVQERAATSSSSINIAKGVFGAMMDVHLINDGPVTIILETR